MPVTVRRATLALVVVLLALAAPAPPVRAAELTTAQGEQHLLALVNRSRAAAGLVALRYDPRLARIARERSADMIARGYYSHTAPDGSDVFDTIADSGIRWYAAGENLGANSFASVTDSAAMVNHQWLESSGHRAVLLGSYNYVGVGLAISSAGRKVWTAVFLRGPDRTRPWARGTRVARSTSTTVRFTWSGADTRLAVHTAGLKDFQVQRRRDDGSWGYVTTSTTSTARTMTVLRGHTYAFRVRARDRNGIVGLWSAPILIST